MAGTYSVVAFAAIGGMLFGLDQGNWGGAIVKEDFIQAFCQGSEDECHDADNLPAGYAQFLSLGSSLLQFGAAVGALALAPSCAARYGRRETMFVGSVITVIGAIPQTIVTQTGAFLCARMIAGVGVGTVTYALPMFVSEVAPLEVRGALGCSMQLTMVAGTLLASVLNCWPQFNYKLSFALPAFPAIVVALGIFCFPVSPRFALLQGRRLALPDGGADRAWKSLRALRGSDTAADKELMELIEGMNAISGKTESSWGTLWKDKSLRRRVLVANMLQWLQQFTGVNAILSYGPSIFQGAGVPLSGLRCAVVTNIFNLVATVVMMLVIDRLGRRFLLLLGAACMMVCMSVATVLAYAISVAQEDGQDSGFLGWCLLGCVCLYMSSYAIAWGGVPWVYPSEIFPMAVKEKALSTSVFSQWTANFVIAYIIPQQVKVMQVSGTFCFYTACLAGCFCLVWCFVPETKGVELEEMGQLFAVSEAGSLNVSLKDNDSYRQALIGDRLVSGPLESSACDLFSLARTRDRASSMPTQPVGLSNPDLVYWKRERAQSHGHVGSPRSELRSIRSIQSSLSVSRGGCAALY